MHVNHSTGRERSGHNFWGLVLPFQCGFVNPADGTQVTRLLWQVLYLVSHLAWPPLYFWMPCLILSLSFITVKWEKAICFFLVFYYFHFSWFFSLVTLKSFEYVLEIFYLTLLVLGSICRPMHYSVAKPLLRSWLLASLPFVLSSCVVLQP